MIALTAFCLSASLGPPACTPFAPAQDQSAPDAVTASVQSSDPLHAAVDVARWIRSWGQERGEGRTWPAVPGEDGPEVQHLYSGSAGPTLFFALLYEATWDKTWKQEALAGARHLVATIPQRIDPQQTGFYTGLSGRAWVLAELSRRLHAPKLREAAIRLYRGIAASAREVGAGVEWNGVSDVISGSAGIGLSLLWAAEHLELPELRGTAAAAGRHLLELGQSDHGGLAWAMSPNYPRRMPNFSHGTAGVAYFLLELHRATQDAVFLEGALAGQRSLEAIADRSEGGFRVYHHEPEGEQLYYLGWCHGPVGTSRLFWRLWQTTHDPAQRERVRAGARSLLGSGIPEQQTEGFWNNVSVCCGTAGAAGFFLELHHALGDKEGHKAHADFADRLYADLMARATRDERGLHWVQAEHRSRPELLQAQTGYMQGAAGIGIELLRLDAARRGRAFDLRFPDCPF